jgi:uncharacterized protein YndB with AHSA1/START domain
MESSIRQGYLVLADISGFTSFLAASELDHANAIVGELLEVIVERLTPLLTLVEFEGDCVYARAEDPAIPAGEVLLEAFESTYLAFRDRVEAVRRHTTCQCNACRLIPTLDLKFITHHGEYMLQSIGGTEKPVGSAVNLVHRLAKNRVTEAQGWRAYALFTAEAAARLGVDTGAMFGQPESYEHLGEVMTYSLDMAARYRELAAARRILVTPADAHAVIKVDIAASRAVVWEWLNDPQKRALWEGTNIKAEKHNGRRGLGARNHCLHGKQAATIQTMVDWKPFDYFTYESQASDVPKPEMLITHELTTIPDGTRLQVRARLLKPMPNALLRVMAAAVLKHYGVPAHYTRLAELLGREQGFGASPAGIPAAPPA